MRASCSCSDNRKVIDFESTFYACHGSPSCEQTFWEPKVAAAKLPEGFFERKRAIPPPGTKDSTTAALVPATRYRKNNAFVNMFWNRPAGIVECGEHSAALFP